MGKIYKCTVAYRIKIGGKVKEGKVSYNSKEKLSKNNKSVLKGIAKMYKVENKYVTILDVTNEVVENA